MRDSFKALIIDFKKIEESTHSSSSTGSPLEGSLLAELCRHLCQFSQARQELIDLYLLIQHLDIGTSYFVRDIIMLFTSTVLLTKVSTFPWLSNFSVMNPWQLWDPHLMWIIQICQIWLMRSADGMFIYIYTVYVQFSSEFGLAGVLTILLIFLGNILLYEG